ncbi:MAG: hypothetical protein HYY40_14760 [Bacteroidetes bacterium]|nr:hypothetical protein [Bacteroidota bacterium]
MNLNIYDFYEKMERNNVLLSFKGEITSELLTSVLQIMETKMENLQEAPKIKKKVYNVLVECLQNLYHHIDEQPETDEIGAKTAMFLIAREQDGYIIVTGNYIMNESVNGMKERLDKINTLNKEELKNFYKEILSNREFSSKGGGGLGMIDIARKSGQKLGYSFVPVNDSHSFFYLNIKIRQTEDEKEIQ